MRLQKFLFGLILFLFGKFAKSWKVLITDPEFEFGDEPVSVAIYRLIGNDMPPLQERGQLRWNTKFALDNEPHFPGAHKRWILNRIWNITEFTLLYQDLIAAGVHRRDIITRCFDIEKYASFQNNEDRLFYLTSQNEARDAGIIDGRESGFEWSVILDGNTFITYDSWMRMQHALHLASQRNQKYLKIPYHRVHQVQSSSWLNSSTTMTTVLDFAPMKGESQIAFHRTAPEMFTLGDTNPDKKDTSKRKGYGQRNKSYMFKEGQICGANSSICACADVPEGNEEDMIDLTMKTGKYTKDCGLVLRLWNYPTPEVIHTGMTPAEENGFFCYFAETYDKIKLNGGHHQTSECARMHNAVGSWRKIKESDKTKYRKRGEKCKEEYHLIYLKESCFRSTDRDLAQQWTAQGIEAMIPKRLQDIKPTLCHKLRPGPTDKSRQHFLTVFDEFTMQTEKEFFMNGSSPAVSSYLNVLVSKAKNSLTLGPYHVTDKERHPSRTFDKRYYYSMRPYFWPVDELPDDLKKQVNAGKLQLFHGYLHREGERLPGTVIGGVHSEYYDHSAAWYMIDNISTLALAWFYTDDIAYAKQGALLAREWFLGPQGMYPTLEFAQDGDRTGLIDWKDIYYLLDMLTLLERSKQFAEADVYEMQVWCAKLARWYMQSGQGHEEGYAFNNHGLYFDLSVLSLAVYAKVDDIVDVTRSRLHYRLSKLAPDGQFGLDGSLYHEISRPTALHYIVVTLTGWVHAALLVEATRANEELPGAMESLFWVRHDGDPHTAQPVLLKAIRWVSQFLPGSENMYKTTTQPVEGMAVNFPYSQTEGFDFDRLLEVIHQGVQYYGLKRVFPDTTPKHVKTVLSWPLYSTEGSSFGKYSSVDPESGNRAWPALGMYQRRVNGNNGYW